VGILMVSIMRRKLKNSSDKGNSFIINKILATNFSAETSEE
jgi:hypothetical protein